MPIPNALTLRKATKIAAKIERLTGKLHALVGDTLELPVDTYVSPVETVKIRRPRGRPPGSVNKTRAGAPSKIAGIPRPASPSGPLAPAVVRVLQRYGRALKVQEILIGLEHDGYIWTAKNPRQTLYVRIGKLAGVKKVGEGLYLAESLATPPVGILPEIIAPPVSEGQW
jgi:hypothetical protein